MTQEKDIEAYLKKQLSLIGGVCWKFTSPGTAGVPDRIVLVKNMVCFVELKRPKGGRLSEVQKIRRLQLDELGAHVYLINTKEKADKFCIYLALGKYPDEV